MTFDEFAQLYCETQESTPEQLDATLRDMQMAIPDVAGWFLGECHMFGSSYLGSRVIVAYGPSCTFKEPPSHPFTPRGLASDTSVVIATMTVEEFRET